MPALSRFRCWIWEAACLAAFLGLTGWQLFVHPLTGLSDNNDFPKVFGPAGICQASHENLNAYFVAGYDAGPACKWPSGFASSEILLVRLARLLGRPFTGRYHFDLRASAAVHFVFLAAAMALFLRLTHRQRPTARYLLPALAILIFTDVAYVAWLNSAYMDNASWVLFLLLVSLAAQDSSQQWVSPAYAIVAILLIFSKAQHAILGVPFAGLAAFYAWSNRRLILRAGWSAAAVVLLVLTPIAANLTPPAYRTISLYNVIFSRLALSDAKVIDQLNLQPAYRKWIGANAFGPGSPLSDPDWTHGFVSQVSFGALASLYLRHPGIAFRELNKELHDSVHDLRPDYMANYRQADGFPPHTAATRFSFWSNFRSRALERYPYSLLVLFLLPFAGLIVGRRALPLLPLALALVAGGVGEFAVCTLADAIDTHRHMFVFQVMTESLILLVVSGALSLLERRPQRQD